ncbi:helix-turn-helix transcriptional regulator [Edwardsiella piscicida]
MYLFVCRIQIRLVYWLSWRCLMNRIREIRKQLGLTQRKLAGLAGCTPGAIGHYELGRRAMSITVCQKIVLIFNQLGASVSLDDVFPQRIT